MSKQFQIVSINLTMKETVLRKSCILRKKLITKLIWLRLSVNMAEN